MLRVILIKFVKIFLQGPRVITFRLLSTLRPEDGKPKRVQPIWFHGKGSIRFGRENSFGTFLSPFYLSSYAYMEARDSSSTISFGDNVHVNNNFSCISYGSSIEIGDDVLIGVDCQIYNSDFHDLNPKSRFGGSAKSSPVVIEDNVFVGSRVTILKGVTIGKGSVIAAGSVVSADIPPNSIAGGVPAKVIATV